MPKRTDIQSVLLIGAGPIIIGQACEFDYSGTQALKALKEEGYRVILVNSNPATIMTDPEFADRTYIEPITTDIVEKIIAKERPDAILPTLGGQTALNLAIDLAEKGILEKYGVEMIGAKLGVDQEGRGPRSVQRGHAPHRPRPAAQRLRAQHEGRHAHSKAPGFSVDHSRVAHAGRQRRQFRLQCRGVQRSRASRPGISPVHEVLIEESVLGLEGIRVGGDARSQGQCRDHLLHREFRSHGRAHRRLDHGSAGADADRQRISDHARRLDARSFAKSASIPAARTFNSPSIPKTAA